MEQRQIDNLYNLLIHLYEVGELSYKVACYMGYFEAEAKEIFVAGCLHDLGKLFLDPNILYKRTAITQEEKNHLQRHVQYLHGIMIMYQGHLTENIIKMIANHHETSDGTGYPNGIRLKDERTMIIRVVDVYNALCSDRPYREKLSKKEALDVIVKEKHLYNKACIEALIAVEDACAFN